ncbi:amidohydrolase family protein [Amycolatopsis jejuensis]|uniref:amidohydrolase family protein n=1 Tax=Amycolatopsis jejuensis TaxID=330084 RepID=UPI000526F62A|nr:amidohydrolase family protein [Amycolatopsis jejuensis]
MAHTLLKGGIPLLWHDRSTDPQDVLIAAGKIAAIGPDLAAPGAEVVDVSGMIVAPGLVDTHTHLWQAVLRGLATGAWGNEYFALVPPLARYLSSRDLNTALYLGALELLDHGVTCVLDYEFAMQSRDLGRAALDGLQAAGIRAILAGDLKNRYSVVEKSFVDDRDRRNGIEWLHGQATALTSIAVALDDIQVTPPETTADVIGWARSLGVPMTFHDNEVGAIATLERIGVLGADILPVHCNYANDADLRALASVGGTISLQPEAESFSGNRSHSVIERARAHGIDLALGVDGPALARLSILPQLRLLYFLQRQLDGARERAAGRLPITRGEGSPTLSARYVAQTGSKLGAEAIGLGDRIGSIEVGYDADLIVLDPQPFGRAHGDPATHLVLYSSEAEIRHVLVAGEFRKRDGRLVGVDYATLAGLGAGAKERILAAAGDAVPPADLEP